MRYEILDGTSSLQDIMRVLTQGLLEVGIFILDGDPCTMAYHDRPVPVGSLVILPAAVILVTGPYPLDERRLAELAEEMG